MFLSVVDNGTVWQEVLNMEDPITVQYEVVEDLFSQKAVTVTKPEEKKKKEPTEVRKQHSNDKTTQ